MKKGFIIVLSVLIFAACNKNNNYPSTPQITLKSISSNVIPNGDSLQVDIGFRDKEGDIQDSVFVEENMGYDSLFLSYPMPSSIPQQSNMSGDIYLTFDYGTGVGGFALRTPQRANTPDTDVLKIYIKDLAGHISDTVQTPPIIVLP
jgi:hypothetical protein